MPIYAPTLPPRPSIKPDKSPILVMARFDIVRIFRLKMGRFFGYVYFCVLLVKLVIIYVNYLLNTNPQLGQLKNFADQVMPQPAIFQASLLDSSMLFFLWLQVALVNGALISRDTLYRIRPLVYSHPVSQKDYLSSKALIAFGIPFCVQLPFILLPWLISILVAGSSGPVWVTAPLLLIPAAILNSTIMGSITLGASSLAGSPKASLGWIIGLLLMSSALGGILSGVFENFAWMAISPIALTESWSKILCGVEKTAIPFLPTAIATGIHVCLWLYIAKRRTLPSEAVI
ncbi:MAG: hypothetical protein FWG02_08180 [Holophagaceae bacterium]|nr:hypothetical protein [Holophagaceae bacterium]